MHSWQPQCDERHHWNELIHPVRFISYLTFGSAENNFSAASPNEFAGKRFAFHRIPARQIQVPADQKEQKAVDRLRSVSRSLHRLSFEAALMDQSISRRRHSDVFLLSNFLSPVARWTFVSERVAPGFFRVHHSSIIALEVLGGRNWIVVYANALPLNYSLVRSWLAFCSWPPQRKLLPMDAPITIWKFPFCLWPLVKMPIPYLAVPTLCLDVLQIYALAPGLHLVIQRRINSIDCALAATI